MLRISERVVSVEVEAANTSDSTEAMKLGLIH